MEALRVLKEVVPHGCGGAKRSITLDAPQLGRSPQAWGSTDQGVNNRGKSITATKCSHTQARNTRQASAKFDVQSEVQRHNRS